MKSGLVLYDFLAARGGAEAVFLNIIDALPNSRGATAFVREGLFDSTVLRRVSVISRPTKSRYLWALTLPSTFLFATKIIRPGDRWIIFTGIYTPFLALTSGAKFKILYCHTPPRFSTDLRQHYRTSLPALLRPFFDIYCGIFSSAYGRALRQMNIVIANSENVKTRLKKYFDVDATVLYPPIYIDKFENLGDEGYYLSTARLEDYKRVDLIIEAFKLMPTKRLIVTSGGSKAEALQRLAERSPNIQFTGWVTSQELSKLVGRCTATIYIPIDEDFGISPVESQAAGKPVIGVNDGGLKETILHGETGILLDAEVTPTTIASAVLALEALPKDAVRISCIKNAKRFSTSVFNETLRRLTDECDEPT
jgi:glycosyltransferase involved in cell wall biosynthesis